MEGAGIGLRTLGVITLSGDGIVLFVVLYLLLF